MSKTKPRKKKRTKYAYLQNWGTYSNQTFVVVGMDFPGCVRALRRLHAAPQILKDFEESKGRFEDHMKRAPGALTWFRDARTILWFPEWANDWPHWDTLTHEVSHLIDAVLVDDKGMSGESEAKAYQAEYLHREIRRALWKAFP